MNNLLNQKELAKECGMSLEWVRKKLKVLDAKEEQVYKNRKFYSQEVLEQLRKLS
jgi:hypothetical protein